MKTRAVAVSAPLIVPLLAATPSFAHGVLYANGPINGTINARSVAVLSGSTPSRASTKGVSWLKKS